MTHNEIEYAKEREQAHYNRQYVTELKRHNAQLEELQAEQNAINARRIQHDYEIGILNAESNRISANASQLSAQAASLQAQVRDYLKDSEKSLNKSQTSLNISQKTVNSSLVSLNHAKREEAIANATLLGAKTDYLPLEYGLKTSSTIFNILSSEPKWQTNLRDILFR